MDMGTILKGEMSAPNYFEAVAEGCIANHAGIVRHGSPEMQTASRMLLYALAAEILRRSRNPVTEDEVQPSDPVVDEGRVPQ